MYKLLAALITPLLVPLLCALPVLASQEISEPLYHLDPLLGLTEPPAPLAAESPVTIQAGAHETKVRINSATPLAPYVVGAERAAELSLDELLLLPDRQEGGDAKDYQVEAGLGLYLEDKASVNLGYRFNELPAFSGEHRSDPLTLSGDLRISFDVKMAF